MKTRMLIVVLAALAVVGMTQAGIISMNFVENPSNQIPAGGELVGPVATDSTYWNHNTVPTTGDHINGTLTGLIDDSGAATGVDIQWHSSNTWYNSDGTADDQHKLSVGYLDDGDGSDGDGKGVIITLTNIPYAEYTVYGLFASDQGDPAGVINFDVNGTWSLGGDATTTADAWGRIDDNFTANSAYWTDIAQGTVKGNYWAVGATGATLTITGETRNGSNRGTLTGIQIVEIPEPATLCLLALGSLTMIRRKKA